MLNIQKEKRDFYMSKLKPLFDDYITSISTWKMAASLESVSTLLALVDTFHPEAILDLGSGFSSVGFRWYCKEKNYSPKLISVDTDKEWLVKTSEYCKKLGLPQYKFSTWEQIKKIKEPFNLVFIDLGYSVHRPSYYDTIFDNFVTKKSVVVFDDAHKSTCKVGQYISKIKNKIEVDIKNLTQDNKRYCRLIYKVVR
jgi:predicted O-methyltransferase YrrM